MHYRILVVVVASSKVSCFALEVGEGREESELARDRHRHQRARREILLRGDSQQHIIHGLYTVSYNVQNIFRLYHANIRNYEWQLRLLSVKHPCTSAASWVTTTALVRRTLDFKCWLHGRTSHPHWIRDWEVEKGPSKGPSSKGINQRSHIRVHRMDVYFEKIFSYVNHCVERWQRRFHFSFKLNYLRHLNLDDLLC